MQDINFDNLLIGLDSKIKILDGTQVRAINFDNAATTPPFRNVVEDILNLSNYYGSIGRGTGQKAEITTRTYNGTRDYFLDFFNIKNKEKYTVIYVGNTTNGINKMAKTFISDRRDIVIATRMEHHSNDLPWRRLCRVEYCEIDKKGRLDLEDLEDKLKRYKGKVRFVTVTGASNVTGYINDIHTIAKLAHKYESKIIVDGAQLVPHVKVDMWGKSPEERIDFLVFSGHKVYAPFGSGVIVGLKEEFDNNLPADEGGGVVNLVMDKKVEYLKSPERMEAGTPNFFGVVSIERSLKILEKIGFDNIHNHEIKLRNKLFQGLKNIPRIINYGDMENYDDRLGIGIFNIESIYHQDIAQVLAKKYGISVRQGWFCCHPYCRRLMHISEKTASAFIHDNNERMPGMIRVSFGIYNTEEEVDYFLNAINNIVEKSK